jgi:hypothetical protein
MDDKKSAQRKTTMCWKCRGRAIRRVADDEEAQLTAIRSEIARDVILEMGEALTSSQESSVTALLKRLIRALDAAA